MITQTLFCHTVGVGGEVSSFLTGNLFAVTLVDFGSAVLHSEKEEEANFESSAVPN